VVKKSRAVVARSCKSRADQKQHVFRFYAAGLPGTSAALGAPSVSSDRVLNWQIADVALFIPKFRIGIRENGKSARNSVRLGQAVQDLSPSGKLVMWHNNCTFRAHVECH